MPVDNGAFSIENAPKRAMALQFNEHFVRIPTRFMEALMRTRLSGSQWIILCWVIRQTYGWNRRSTAFSWYRVAKETGLDRPSVYRSGKALVQAGFLTVMDGRIAVQVDSTAWGEVAVRTGRHRLTAELSARVGPQNGLAEAYSSV